MKSLLFEEFGLPQNVLQLRETKIPDPKEGEVRVKVVASPINPSDIMNIRGLYGLKPEFPAVAGFEGSGEIDELGPGVDLETGSRVAFSALGVWREYAVVQAKACMSIPDDVPHEIACQAYINPFTAYGMLETSGLKSGDWLMLTAGGSAFAKFVLQLGHPLGIKIICAVRRDDLVEPLRALGAAAVVNTEKEDLVKRTYEITHDQGVNRVFEAVSGEVGQKALRCLKVGGTMLVFGRLSLEDIPLNSGMMLFRGLTIKGFWLSQWMSSLSRAERNQVVANLPGMLGTNLNPEVEAVYKLDKIRDAIEHSQRPGRNGKVVLDIGLPV